MTVSVVESASELATTVSMWKKSGETIALVPTMGSLHAGHLALVTRARELADRVVVSIFVNPLQFGQGEDFDDYPRTPDSDVDVLQGVGVDVVFAPQVTDVYPKWPEISGTLTAGDGARGYEGADRPGHFDGVVTVVSRLFDLVRCDWAVFGQKDAQQVFVVSQMAESRTPPVAISVVETVRDVDGLALSSRNSFLSEASRASALIIPAVLADIVAVIAAAGDGELTEEGVSDLIARGSATLSGDGREPHYLDIVDAKTFKPWRGGPSDTVIVMAACTVGGVRLIDATAVTVGSPPGD